MKSRLAYWRKRTRILKLSHACERCAEPLGTRDAGHAVCFACRRVMAAKAAARKLSHGIAKSDAAP